LHEWRVAYNWQIPVDWRSPATKAPRLRSEQGLRNCAQHNLANREGRHQPLAKRIVDRKASSCSIITVPPLLSMLMFMVRLPMRTGTPTRHLLAWSVDTHLSVVDDAA
jgi:hypothetical protein